MPFWLLDWNCTYLPAKKTNLTWKNMYADVSINTRSEGYYAMFHGFPWPHLVILRSNMATESCPWFSQPRPRPTPRRPPFPNTPVRSRRAAHSLRSCAAFEGTCALGAKATSHDGWWKKWSARRRFQPEKECNFNGGNIMENDDSPTECKRYPLAESTN